MKTILLIALLLIASNCYLKHPTNNYQNIFSKKAEPVNIGTQCNQLNLTDINSNLKFAYSGYLTAIRNTNSVLGFIFYGSQQATSLADLQNYPILIWLNGGPGSTSQLGNFQELGPIRPLNVTANNDTVWQTNQYSWNLNYSILFIDQPIGTGLSYAENYSQIPINMDQVGEQFYYALNQLYNNNSGCFKQLNLGNNDLFIFGESYAGKYVPGITKYILNQKQQQQWAPNLKAIAMGDGFTDPLTIVQNYGLYAYNLGLIDFQERQYVENIIMQTTLDIQNGNWVAASNDFQYVLDYISNQSGINNVYNVRQMTNPNVFNSTYSDVDLTIFLNNATFVQKFNLSTQLTFNSQSNNVSNALNVDFMQRYTFDYLSSLIDQIPVLLYNGQNDLIVCTPCNMAWIDKLSFNDAPAFQSADFNVWRLPNQTVAGYMKSAGNLEFRTVNKAGHLVPNDQPVSAYYLSQYWVEKYRSK